MLLVQLSWIRNEVSSAVKLLTKFIFCTPQEKKGSSSLLLAQFVCAVFSCYCNYGNLAHFLLAFQSKKVVHKNTELRIFIFVLCCFKTFGVFLWKSGGGNNTWEVLSGKDFKLGAILRRCSSEPLLRAFGCSLLCIPRREPAESGNETEHRPPKNSQTH